MSGGERVDVEVRHRVSSDGARQAVSMPAAATGLRSRIAAAWRSVASPTLGPVAATCLTLATDALLLVPAVGLRVDFGFDDPYHRFVNLARSIWPSQELSGLSAYVLGAHTVHLACGLWCCAVLGRIAWRNVRGGLTPTFGLAVPWPSLETGTYVARRVPFPVVRWRGKDGVLTRTWPGALAGLALGTALAVASPSGLQAPEWSPVHYGFRGYTRESGPVPVWRVEAGSPLDEAGVRLGDVIRTLDGAPVRSALEFRLAVEGAARRELGLGIDRYGDDGPHHLSVRVPVGTSATRGTPDDPVGTVGDLRGLFDWGVDRVVMSYPRRIQALATGGWTYLGFVSGQLPVDESQGFTTGGRAHMVQSIRYMHFVGAFEWGTLLAAAALAALSVLSWCHVGWRWWRHHVSKRGSSERLAQTTRTPLGGTSERVLPALAT